MAETLTLTAESLIEKITELKSFMAELRTTEQKVNVQQMADSFTPEQTEAFKRIQTSITVLDGLLQKNYDSSVAQVANAMISVLASDCLTRKNYLMEVDKKAKKIEVDADLSTKIAEAKLMKSNIIAFHQLLVNMKVKLPASLYKEGRKSKDGKIGEKLLDLPRIEDVNDEGEVSKRGRALRSETIVLGTIDPQVQAVNEETGETEFEVTWHEAKNVGDVFVNLYGTIRADHSQFGLFKAVEKSDQSVTKGWNIPVDYAGKLWVAKVKA